MKIILLLTIFLSLASCSSKQKRHKIENASWDAMSGESFQRWGDKRLSTAQVKDPVVIGCYQGKVDESLAQYKSNYEQKKDNPYYWLHIGNCYVQKQEYKKADFFYRLSLEEAKEPAVKALTFNNLGLLNLKYHHWEKARDNFEKAISLQADLKVPRFNLAQLHLQFGHYDQAISNLSHSIFQGKQDVDITFSLANAYLYKGDLQKAEEHFKRLPEEYFTREDIALTYSLFLLKKGEVEAARDAMARRDISSEKELKDITQKVERLIEGRSRK